MHRALLAPLFVVWLPASLLAQRLSGIVRDSASALPLPGAVVSVLDSTGAVVVRTLTNQAGRFSFLAGPAFQRLRVVRIGFTPRALALEPRPGGDVALDITMVGVPLLLEGVEVSAQPLCPPRDDRRRALSAWEQTRAGLLATLVAIESNPAQMRLLRFHRDVDAGSGNVLAQTVNSTVGMTQQPFISARPPKYFVDSGYVERLRGDTLLYRAPDVGILLDPSFAETHCFAVARADDRHASQIGIDFEPVPGRQHITDVAGTVWLDRTTPALASLQYHYTPGRVAGAGSPLQHAEGSGGLEHFQTMPNGATVIDYWYIRTPRAAVQATPVLLRRVHSGQETLRVPLRVVTFSDTGGQIASALWRDGQRWDATLGTISGRVLSPTGHRPLASVRVWLDNTDDASLDTDSTGHFAFTNLLPGPYSVHAADMSLAAFGITSDDSVATTAGLGHAAATTVDLVPVADAVAARCGNGQIPDSFGMLVGTVTASGGAPAPHAAITLDAVDQPAEWRVRERAQTADRAGYFVFCRVPRELPLRVVADEDTRKLGRFVATATITLRQRVEGVALQLVPTGK